MKKILAISGSTKSTSTSLAILKFIQKKYHKQFDLSIYNKIANLAHFNPELEADLPTSVQQFRNLIEAADGVLFCTPEYVFSLPGSLKNAIEWNVSTVLFSNKPVAMIVAAASGAKAFESLSLIMTTIEACMPDESKLLIQGAKGILYENGDISDKGVVEQIDKLVQSLMRTVDDDARMASKYL